MFEFPIIDLSTTAIVAIGVTAFLAALARGFSGFGAALIFMPVAGALVGPRMAAPMLLIIDGIVGIGMIPDAWRRAKRREVLLMALGAVAGIPAGTLILTGTDPVAIRWVIVATASLMLALLISGWRYRGRPSTTLTVGTGAISGLFGGIAQVSGPPVVAYWLGGPSDVQVVRANIVLFFVVSTVVSLTSYAGAGLMTTELVWLSVYLLPVYGLGMFIGMRLFGHASPDLFRRICYVLIAVAVLLGLPILDSVIR